MTDAMAAPGLGQTVCVTGAGGYIGSWIVKLLLERGYTSRGTVRNPEDAKNGETFTRCSDEVNPRKAPYKISNQRLRELGLEFTPAAQALYETVVCFQDKGVLPVSAVARRLCRSIEVIYMSSNNDDDYNVAPPKKQ